LKSWWAIAFSVVITFLAAGLLYLVTRPPRGEAIILLPPPTPAPIVVQVAGAVLNPKVCSLPSGSRVQDAIACAGGFSQDANQVFLNLAALMKDGERVIVPTLSPSRFSTITGSSPVTETVLSPTPVRPININTASQSDFESLPGIGPVLAARIIAYRDAHGPFKTVDELQNVPGIGLVVFARLKNDITVSSSPD
jgi:competence protein ComEA